MGSLLEKNKRGLIHGPDESDEAFLQRCRKAKKCDNAPYSSRAKKIYDINPDWVQIRFSDQRLRLWEGGCTWIEEDNVTLQLRKAFEKKTRYFGYSSDEIVAHELVHVVRNSFEEPIFEEILAYRTSPSWLRRFFGPSFRSSKESLFFVFSLVLVFFSTLFSNFQIIAFLGFLSIVLWGTGRLIRAQHIFSKTCKKIAKIVGKKRSLAVMIRLTDREIIRFSKMEKEQIIAYAIKMSRSQIRWQQIRKTYFNQSK